MLWNHNLYPLRTVTNTHAQLFTDSVPYVWNEKTMTKYVSSNRDKVLERMRLLLGARTYLADPKVIAIFKKQKERMGTMLDQLDTDMATHTRSSAQTTTDPVTGASTTTMVAYTAWQKQNLLTEWNTYMDTKWNDATAKHKKAMDKFVNDLDDKHCQSRSKKSTADRQFCDRLRKLQTAYAGATAFSKPW
ncbi:hypothetical protein BU23DRAFT_169724 [Bimuria novae-zelandiae CBS 107.79]|uniref:Uncharacterized protein n=1 Tax=Bimuria novae-zelandiae CBS 107.79 TaxID=1447943 RepID=A0A6A5VAG1_9PLEO|nr:hypothetical protein BU23DRAFT_169724 [Bimuria novae-zelandiae CBS 107.79]